MNSREYLKQWAEYAERHLEDSKADAAALRELDALLSDFVRYSKAEFLSPADFQGLRDRAAQAGYGEK